MKDMYSFSRTEEEHNAFYARAQKAYLEVFKRLGLEDITYVTSASGGVFTDKFSHEFQTICEAGEDTIYITDESKREASNAEVSTEGEEKKAAEVGNIFTFGTQKCEQLGLYYNDETGKKVPVFLGSYGIGVTRLLGVLAEVFSDEKGLMWPKAVAPFRVHLISLNQNEAASEIYKTLEAEGIEVLYDDRDVRAGEKFADADLIGIPTRVVVGEKSLESKMLEVKDRGSDEVRMLSLESLVSELTS